MHSTCTHILIACSRKLAWAHLTAANDCDVGTSRFCRLCQGADRCWNSPSHVPALHRRCSACLQAVSCLTRHSSSDLFSSRSTGWPCLHRGYGFGVYQRFAGGSLGRLVLFMSYLAAALQYYASLPIAHMGQGWFLPVVPLLVESK